MAMDAVEFAWKNNLESASLSLNNEKERLAKEGRAKFHMSDLEKRERLACGVHRIISGWVHSLQDEIEAIRAARLAELYQK